MKFLFLLAFCFCSCSTQDFIWDEVEWSSPAKISRVAVKNTEEDFLYELILEDLTENPDYYTEEEVLDVLLYDSHLQQ